VQCCGSPLFLKGKYGVGYHLTLSKESQCDVDAISSLIQKMVPAAECEGNIGAELIYLLPRESSPAFPR
jgi:ATP-binding cassette subfamily A (ABC1) protein 3